MSPLRFTISTTPKSTGCDLTHFTYFPKIALAVLRLFTTTAWMFRRSACAVPAAGLLHIYTCRFFFFESYAKLCRANARSAF